MVVGNRSIQAALLCVATLLGSVALAATPKPATQIGAVIPESWPDKAHGEEIRNGMLLALKTWPGQPAPTLVVHDSACDAKKAATAAQSLLDAKVDVVVGGFCVLGTLPRVFRDAGVPFVSANAERFATGTDTAMQLGVVPVNLADTIALKLRADTGLRVTAGSACWIDYDNKVPDKYDAALCPTLHIDNARWDEIAPTYAAAYRKPFTTAAARGYAAMQVALAAIKQMRAGSKQATVLKDMKEVSTVLGKVHYGADAAPDDAMQLVLSAKLPRLSAREAAVLDEVVKSKGCGCARSGECPQSKSWGAMPFVVQCAPGQLTAKR
jgi:hypothetical protein